MDDLMGFGAARRGAPGACGMNIPCKYPDKGPMLYEMMEYCAELTRQADTKRRDAPARTTARGDTFLYPRGFDEEPATEEAQAEQLTQAQREAAWVRAVEERIHRRRRAEAGYDPDISRGLRRVGNADDEDDDDSQAVPQAEQPGAAAAAKVPQSAANTVDEAEEQRPAPRRYGVVLREVAADAAAPAAAPATTASPAAAGESDAAAPAASPPVAEVLRRVFAADHPGVAPMCAWLEEEGVATAAQLQALLAPGTGSKGGAAALRELGFRPEWAEAVAARAPRAAAAAAKAAAVPR